MTTPIATLYADGGVVGPNPSSLGIAWAYRACDADDRVIYHSSGLYLCDDAHPTLGNNFAELLAVVEAMLRDHRQYPPHVKRIGETHKIDEEVLAEFRGRLVLRQRRNARS